MDNEQRQHLQELQGIYQKRLRVLERQAANKGHDTPPHIQVEIDDINKRIAGIEAQIAGRNRLIANQLSSPVGRRGVWIMIVALIGAGIIAVWLANMIGEARGRQATKAELQPTIDALQVRPIAIDSIKDWQSTGFVIASGDKVTIHVVGGKWTSWLDVSDENDGSGESRTCAQCPVKGYTPSALVAKIGDTKYGIGNSCVFNSMSGGELSLQINDDKLSDNSGVLSVEITIGQSLDTTNRQPCGTPVD
jgi:PA-IL-like protein